MSIQVSSRCAAALFLIALLAACSSTGSGSSPSPSGQKSTSLKADDKCRANRSQCLYNGAYEPGEKDYAEEEARRLNLAESARLRRAFGK